MALAWDDFRLVKCVADRGGLTAAARELGINHSTAFRRLEAVEAALGARLFERSRTGYIPTAAGTAMVEAAADMEADVARFDRRLIGQVAEPSGVLRVTAPAAFVSGLLMPVLAAFGARYPAIALDLVASEETLNLSRRDADIAFRASNNPPGNLVGRRLTAIAWAVYGRSDRVYPDPRMCRWVSLAPQVAGGVMARFVATRAAPGRVALQLNAVLGLCEAIEAGIGIGPLPCLQGDRNPALRRLGDPVPELAATFWLLTHPDLRHAPRVRALMDFAADAILPLRPCFEGRTPLS